MESLNALTHEIDAIVLANPELRASGTLLQQSAAALLANLEAIDGLSEHCVPRLQHLVLNLLEGHLPPLLTMTRPTAAESSAAYPLLSTLIQRSLNTWCETQTEIFAALIGDWQKLEQDFGPLDRFVSVAAPSGDFHRGGRSVRVLHFESGRKIVFKPRSMRVDQAFQNFISWANKNGLEPRLRRLNVLDRQTYGWTEFVEVRTCGNEAEVHRFDERAGALLALLHVIGATDVHFQNILATGEHPVVIDLETLFHRFPRHTEEDAQTASGTAYLEAVNSVTSVGLLSWPLPVGPETWLDMGGLGGRFHPPGRMKRVEATNRPLLFDEVAPVHFASIFEGYRSAYEMLLENKQELLSPTGPLAEFRGTRVRVVIQGTYVYQQTLIRSYSGENLRDEVSRQKYFADGFQNGPPGIQQFAQSEVAQLMSGDVPYFDIEVDGDELSGADGSIFKNVAGQNGWTTATERVNRLSREDFERQSWFMHAAYGFTHGCQSVSLSSKDLANGLRDIAEHLASLAVVKADSASWMSYDRVSNADDEPLFTVDAMKRDFASGLAGLAIFYQSLSLTDSGWRELEGQIATSIAEPRSPQTPPPSAQQLGAEVFATARSSRPSRAVFENLLTELARTPTCSASILLGLHAAKTHWPEADSIARQLIRNLPLQNDLVLAAACLAFDETRPALELTPEVQTSPVHAIAHVLIAKRLHLAAWQTTARESVRKIMAENSPRNLALLDGQSGALAVAKASAAFFDSDEFVLKQEQVILEALRTLGFVSKNGERTNSLGLAYGLAGLGYALSMSENEFDAWPMLLLS